MTYNKIGMAVIGAGGFAHFAVTEFVKNPKGSLVGVFDELSDNANRLKEIKPTIRVYKSLDALYADPDVSLVYIATPPYLHYEQSKGALLAGKHVICEKPAATSLSHAVELRALAEQRNLLFVVNLMQRYNPLYAAVRQIIDTNLLGGFLHGFFENYASDEFLSAQHWFWDKDKSGGIFIEHGVHFFDMFSGWLGKGKVVASQKMSRPNHPAVWDKFQAVVQYQCGLVNFYHGFDQPKAMDRQEMRLLFEKGEITLYEWVPTRLVITALCTGSGLHELKSLFPDSKIEMLEDHGKIVTAKGGFKSIHYQYKCRLHTPDSVQKSAHYQQLVAAMFDDQLTWIQDRTHIRKIDQNNAVSSLETAEEAELMAVHLQP